MSVEPARLRALPLSADAATSFPPSPSSSSVPSLLCPMPAVPSEYRQPIDGDSRFAALSGNGKVAAINSGGNNSVTVLALGKSGWATRQTINLAAALSAASIPFPVVHGVHLSKDGAILVLAVSNGGDFENRQVGKGSSSFVFFLYDKKSAAYVYTCINTIDPALGRFGVFGTPSESPPLPPARRRLEGRARRRGLCLSSSCPPPLLRARPLLTRPRPDPLLPPLSTLSLSQRPTACPSARRRSAASASARSCSVTAS